MELFVKLNIFFSGKTTEKLKADRPHPHYYPYMPLDYGHTDNTLQTNGQMDRQTDATKCIISLLREATWAIKKRHNGSATKKVSKDLLPWIKSANISKGIMSLIGNILKLTKKYDKKQ